MRIISHKAIVCLGLSLVLSSCGSRRQVSDMRIDEDLIRRIEMAIDEALERRMVEIKTSDLNADITITERKFDTEKEIDPATGERPELSRTDARIVIGRRDSTATADSLGFVRKADVVDDIDKDTSVEIKEKDVKDNKWPMVIISLSVLGIMVMVFIILKRLGIIK